MGPEKPRRNTRQRQVVLEELKKTSSHPTAAELHEVARQRLPKISLGTVYRNLELLAGSGVIRKLENGGPETRFDGDPSRHFHIRCIRCGRVDDAPGLPEDPLKGLVDSLDGYEIMDFHLEFIGVCPACRGRPAPHTDNGNSYVAEAAQR